MRLLHTSDWHLGRSLHRADLQAGQEAFLDHLVETARAERVDAVLVSGDVYDRAIPPVDAIKLCEEALSRLRDAGARVILISGNHDSARRLGFGANLFGKAGVHLLTRAELLATPVTLADEHGPVGVYGIPYTEPAVGLPGEALAAQPAQAPDPESALVQAGPAAGEGSPGEPGDTAAASPGTDRTHRAVLGEATRQIRADAAARGLARTVVLAHAWVTGGQASNSERDIRTARDGRGEGLLGGAGDVPASVFDGFSYVALGHLHGQQTLASHLRYSGSPLPYSFSERAHRKGSWLVELDGAGQVSAERVAAPVYRRLSVLAGTLQELLASGDYAAHEQDFVAVTLTDAVRPEQAMDRLRRRFPHVLTLEFQPAGGHDDARSYLQRTAGKSDLEVAAEFIRHVRGGEATDGERGLLAAAFAAGGGEDGHE